MTEQEMFQKFFSLFNWIYGIELPSVKLQIIANAIRDGWHNNDTSEQELVVHVLRIHEQFANTSIFLSAAVRKELIGHFNTEFAQQGGNDRSRVMAILQRSIEDLSPGVTQKDLQLQPSKVDASPPYLQPYHPSGKSAPPPKVPPFDVHKSTPDLYEQQRIKQREMQLRALESNIAKMEHDMAMGVIGNIR